MSRRRAVALALAAGATIGCTRELEVGVLLAHDAGPIPDAAAPSAAATPAAAST